MNLTNSMKRLSTAAVCVATALTACSKTSSTDAPENASGAGEGLPDRDPQLAKRLVSEGALLLDVRSDGEWNDGHLAGASHIPVDDLEGRLAEVEQKLAGDKTKPIVVYCRSGGRAGRAKEMLLKAGYTQVTNMGGMDDWPSD